MVEELCPCNWRQDRDIQCQSSHVRMQVARPLRAFQASPSNTSPIVCMQHTCIFCEFTQKNEKQI